MLVEDERESSEVCEQKVSVLQPRAPEFVASIPTERRYAVADIILKAVGWQALKHWL